MRLSLSRSDDEDATWLDGDVVDALTSIATELGPTDKAVDVVLVDDARIQEINRDFRSQDKATDVISFSYLEDHSVGDHDDLAGEIYISHETLVKEATQLGIRSSDLFLRLGVHGIFHVLGRDHETDASADSMEAEERRVLERYLDPETMAVLF